jgi:hypothetical protein
VEPRQAGDARLTGYGVGMTDRDKQLERAAQALDEKQQEARVKAEHGKLAADAREPDDLDPRAKNSGHKKKTADKWNQ